MFESSHRPDGKMAEALNLILACTTANDASATPACTRRRGLNVSIAPMGDSRVACCSQGGGVYVTSGTVTITSSSIYGNTAAHVRAHLQKFPMPPRETHVWLVVCRAVVSLSHPAQSQSSTPKFIPIKLLVSSCVLMLKSSHRPDRKVADTLCLDSRLHNCGRLFDQLQSVRAAET
jgi:hypothetical protein